MSEVNKKKLRTKLDAAGEWLRLRKKTVVAHWLFGALCTGIAHFFFPAGLAMMGVFAGEEYWNDKCEGTHEGDKDWWDAWLIFCIGLAVLVILQLCGKVSTRWY